jgi:hypothetical protein
MSRYMPYGGRGIRRQILVSTVYLLSPFACEVERPSAPRFQQRGVSAERE